MKQRETMRKLSVNLLSRASIHMGRIVPEIDPFLAEKIANNSLNLKRIVTRRNNAMVELPAKLQFAAETRIRNYSDRLFRREAKLLIDVMKKLKLPDEKHTLKQKQVDIYTQYEVRDKLPQGVIYDPEEFTLSEQDMMAKRELAQLISGTLEDRRRDWHYYEYDERSSNLYMAIRLAPNYACLKTVMKEIHDLEPDFKPKSVLDFGSGMGTTIWAVNETWPNSVSEFMNVDISREQQYLCELLLRDGRHSGDPLPGIFHRQYLPASTKTKYDLVVAAFTLLELPNSEMRAQTIENLWQKTNDMLVIVERGNSGGFATINEARHFILDLTGHDVTKKLHMTLESRPNLKQRIPESHVFAPCSHEFVCPRAMMTSKKNMNNCRFSICFEPLEIGDRKSGIVREEFSYVILRKRPHPSYLTQECPMRLPRIIEPRKHSGRQITHKICCPSGNLAETTITAKKYGKSSYELAKSCNWGDLLPIKVKDTYETKNSRLIKDR